MRWLILFIRSHILIALASVFFYWSGSMLLGISFHFPAGYRAAILFLSTLLIYHLPEFPKAAANPKRHHGFLIFYIITVVVIVFFAFFITVSETLFLIHLGVISFLYNYPFDKPDIRFLPVRLIPLIKVFLIGYVWSCIGSVFICIAEFPQINWEGVADIWIIQFLFILSITLPFDIRDYSTDRKRNLKTIPGILGVQRTKYLAYLMALIFTITAGLTLSLWYAFIIIGSLVLLVVRFSNEKRQELYFTGLIDGLIIVYALIIYLTLPA